MMPTFARALLVSFFLIGSALSEETAPPTEGYVEFATNKTFDLQDRLCQLQDDNIPAEEIAAACAKSKELAEIERFKRDLPAYFYANYLSLTVVWALLTDVPTGFTESPDLAEIFFEAVRFHRVLGYGNALRLSGNSEETVNAGSWAHESILIAEDGESDSIGTLPGVEGYCEYINQEFEQLKQLAMKNYPSDLPPEDTSIAADIFKGACSGYVIRSDWEGHRREILAAILKGCPRPVVLHTLWHFNSLWYAGGDNSKSYEQFEASFDVLLEHLENGSLVDCEVAMPSGTEETDPPESKSNAATRSLGGLVSVAGIAMQYGM